MTGWHVKIRVKARLTSDTDAKTGSSLIPKGGENNKHVDLLDTNPKKTVESHVSETETGKDGTCREKEKYLDEDGKSWLKRFQMMRDGARLNERTSASVAWGRNLCWDDGKKRDGERRFP